MTISENSVGMRDDVALNGALTKPLHSRFSKLMHVERRQV